MGKRDHTTKIGVTHVVPLYNPMVSKGDPTGLRSNGNIEKRYREQKHRPSPLFPLNPPIIPCPKVSMISKLNT